MPSNIPSNHPTVFPSQSPSGSPSYVPSHLPTVTPTQTPTKAPSSFPTRSPTIPGETRHPTSEPSFLLVSPTEYEPIVSIEMSLDAVGPYGISLSGLDLNPSFSDIFIFDDGFIKFFNISVSLINAILLKLVHIIPLKGQQKLTRIPQEKIKDVNHHGSKMKICCIKVEFFHFSTTL